MERPTATYSYAEVIVRVAAVLGERPSRSALRAAAAEAGRSRSTNSRVRLTAGMPAPLPSPTRTSPARFDAAAIDRWLAHHPRLQAQSAYTALVAAARKEPGVDDVAVAVRQARQHGLSWRQIAEALSEGTGTRRSPQGVFKAFRHLG